MSDIFGSTNGGWSITGASGSVTSGGNFGPITLGTRTEHDLSFETNGVVRAKIAANGEITAPNGLLEETEDTAQVVVYEPLAKRIRRGEPSTLDGTNGIFLKTNGSSKLTIDAAGEITAPNGITEETLDTAQALVYEPSSKRIRRGEPTTLDGINGVYLKTNGSTRMAINGAGAITLPDLALEANPEKFLSYNPTTDAVTYSDAAPGVTIVTQNPTTESFNEALYINQSTGSLFAYNKAPTQYELSLPADYSNAALAVRFTGAPTVVVTSSAEFATAIGRTDASLIIDIQFSINCESTLTLTANNRWFRSTNNNGWIVATRTFDNTYRAFSASGENIVFTNLKFAMDDTLTSVGACVNMTSVTATNNAIVNCTFYTDEFAVTSTNPGITITGCVFNNRFTGGGVTQDSHRYISLARVTAPTYIHSCTFQGNQPVSGTGTTQAILLTGSAGSFTSTLDINGCSNTTRHVQRLMMVETGFSAGFVLVVRNCTFETSSGFVIHYDSSTVSNACVGVFYNNTETLATGVTGSKGLLGFDAASGTLALPTNWAIHAWNNTLPALRADYASAMRLDVPATESRVVAYQTTRYTTPAALYYVRPAPIAKLLTTNLSSSGIALGNGTGPTTQAANSIIINGTGTAINNTVASSTVITPIRFDVAGRVLTQNETTKEIGASGMWVTSSDTYGIGTTNPARKLHVNGGSITCESYTGYNYDTAYGTFNFSRSILLGGNGALYTAAIDSGASLHYAGGFINQSDSRIKCNIEPIDDASALSLLRLIEPKSYNYVDPEKVTEGKVWGFIAQDVRAVFPDAVVVREGVVPDIQCDAHLSEDILTLSKDLNLQAGDKILLSTGVRYTITEIVTPLQYRLQNVFEKEDRAVQVLGRVVPDFHFLKKDYLFTINLAATQELDRNFTSLEKRITDLEQKLQQK